MGAGTVEIVSGATILLLSEITLFRKIRAKKGELPLCI